MGHWIVEPGFFANQPVRTALIVGLIVAVSSGVVGVYVVMRAQSFAGHALADVASAGGAGASVIGASALGGFLAGGVIGAGAIDVIGVNRVRSRDVATGIVLGAATGAAALFFHLASVSGTSSSSTQQVLFGSIFTVPASIVPAVAVVATLVVVAVAVGSRPLLLSSLSEELAVARGLRVRAVDATFIVLVALVVALASVAVGSILSTALLIGPAAAAAKVTRSTRGAVVLAAATGVAATWLGILMSYDSYVWSGNQRAVPASGCIVAFVIVFYAAATVITKFARGARR
jgi:zinc/manganese transport system permease protein